MVRIADSFVRCRSWPIWHKRTERKRNRNRKQNEMKEANPFRKKIIEIFVFPKRKNPIGKLLKKR